MDMIKQDPFLKYNLDQNPPTNQKFFSLITNFIEPGNIIPNFWYKKITDTKDNPDLTAITILSEIIALYRLILKDKFPIGTFIDADRQPVLVGTSLRTSYENFSDKFCLSKEKVRRALIRLEELNIIERGVSNVALSDGSRCNKLIVTVNPNFLESCFRDPNTDIRTQKEEYSFKTIKSTEKNTDNNKIQSLQISYDHYISNKNNINKNRSIGSNIFKSDFEAKNSLKVDSKNILTALETKGITDNTNFEANKIREKHLESTKKSKNFLARDYFPEAKKLKDFYPLTSEDCSILQSSSKREFGLNAMNEILKDISKRLTNKFFYSKKGFMSYMSKVFAYEMRDAVKINNESFKIKCNEDAEERKKQEIERYLTKVENSLHVSPEWHFKKKIACVLRPETAYEFLINYRELSKKEGRVQIKLDNHVELTEMEKAIILEQLQASYEHLDGIFDIISEVEFIVLEKTSIHEEKEGGTKTNFEVPKREGIWGRVRETIARYESEQVEQAWFSKLEAEVDELNKQIRLKAPNSLYKDWINNNFDNSMRKAAKFHGYTIQEIYCLETSQD